MNENSNQIKDNKISKIVELFIVIIGIMLIALGLVMFNRYLLNKIVIPIRLVLLILLYWSLLIPIFIATFKRNKLEIFGFTKNHIFTQILVGVGLALVVSFVLTAVPILLGFREFVGGKPKYTYFPLIAYDFLYMLIAVSFVEELIFRGYIFHQIKSFNNSKWLAIILSSIIFGFFHIFSGNIVQVIVTSLIGIMFCVLRDKIKHCSILSLIIIHGLHNWLITIWLILL